MPIFTAANDKARRQQQERIEQTKQEPDRFLQFRVTAERLPASLGRFAEPFKGHAKDYQTSIVDQFAAKRHRIRTSGAYTPHGEQTAIAQLTRESRAEIAKRRAAVTKMIGGEIAERRAAARPKNESKEDSAVQYWRRREIREHLASQLAADKKLDSDGRPLALMTALEGAIARGQGHDWLDALEGAPVPLVESHLIADVRTRLIDSSDPELALLAEYGRAHEQILNFAERGIIDTANADGVALNTPEAKGEDAPPSAPPPFFGSGSA